MGNKEDWEEIDSWKETKKQEELDKYGLSFEDVHVGKKKRIDRFASFLKAVGVSYVVFATIIFSIAIIVVGIYLYVKYMDIKSQVDIDLVDTIQSMYNIKIDIISQDTDNKGNGKYVIKLKNSDVDIIFNAVKDKGSLKEDYIARSQKYYFDRWESKAKENFKIVEKEENDILNYETYIEIDNYDELIKAVESINEFFEYSRQKLFAAWNVYIKYGKIIIDPYTSSSDTKEDAIKNAQDQFKIKSKIIQE